MKQWLSALVLVPSLHFAQNIPQKLDAAVKDLLSTAPAYSASVSMYVADKDGNFIYEYNGNKGLSTASTLKIFTAAAALETLGKDYRYTTTIATDGTVSSGKLNGNLVLNSTGDPTLGSWRYDGYKPEDFKAKVLSALKQKGISTISGDLIIDDSYFDFQTVPGGWPWNDMGNYYGAGVWGVNWRENQFDIQMNGKEMNGFNTELPGVNWVNDIKAAGTSDQSIIYTAPHSNTAHISGTLPAKAITVSGAMPNPPITLGGEMKKWFSENNIQLNGKVISTSEMRINGIKPNFKTQEVLLSYQSPTLDKMVYWFLKKSINFYGETFIKTLGKEKKGAGSFSAGMDYLKEFWKSKGINSAMINFADGSGLSPQNYVSARAEVQALLWSKKQPWFPAYFEGFPTQGNGMKMKSGTMKDVKSFAGYHGNYVFSIIINNYQGSSPSEALYKVLNVLK